MSVNSSHYCNQAAGLEGWQKKIAKNEKRTLWVILLTFSTMIVEVVAGYWTGSMALLADGYHMASHAGALGITYFVYRLAKSSRLKNRLTFGTGKLLPLGGYTSCLGLGLVAIWMAIESISRFISPVAIQFEEAIFVAVIGLIVNLVSIKLLGDGGHHHHHDHEDHFEDHNHRSAKLHVMADALTSFAAIFALIFAKYLEANWMDPLMGVIGGALILRWALQLGRVTARELLDAEVQVNVAAFKERLRQDGVELLDFHSWKIAPENIAVQLVVQAEKEKPQSYYRELLHLESDQAHFVVEHRPK